MRFSVLGIDDALMEGALEADGALEDPSLTKSEAPWEDRLRLC